MNRMILTSMLLFPVAICAQERSLEPTNGRASMAARMNSAESPETEPDNSMGLDDSGETPRTESGAGQVAQQDRPPAQPPPARGSNAAGKEPSRPKMAGSTTGYIDNAIVGSQVRLRFDSGFGIKVPDRAEFFYGKCGCYRYAYGTPALDPNAPGPGGPSEVEAGLSFQEIRLDLEYSPTNRFSVFVDVPARFIQPTDVPKASGIGDVRAGFKFALNATPDRYLTFQLRNYFPSGNARRGLGTNHWSVEPALVLYQKLSPRLALAAQIADFHPIGGSAGVPTASSDGFAGDVLSYGLGASYDLTPGRRVQVAPVLEMVGWKVLGGFETRATGPSSADGRDIVNIKIGVRISERGPSSFYVGYGKALTNANWYEDIVRAEYRYAF